VTSDKRRVSERFSRSSQNHPEWVLANASGAANALWVLDLGCGRAACIT
jgi:hypothetical protein